MARGDDRPIPRGDKGFVWRLIGAAGVVVVLGILILGLLDQSRLGTCAARGFREVTAQPPSD